MTEVLHGPGDNGHRVYARSLDVFADRPASRDERIGGAMLVTIVASVCSAIGCGILAAILGADLFSILVCYIFGGNAGLLATALMLSR